MALLPFDREFLAHENCGGEVLDGEHWTCQKCGRAGDLAFNVKGEAVIKDPDPYRHPYKSYKEEIEDSGKEWEIPEDPIN